MKVQKEWKMNKGFTLIELMIIIAITAILLALIFGDGRERSRPIYNKGDCVVHTLNPEVKGIVLRAATESYITVRFASAQDEQVYYEHELEYCDNDDELTVE